MASPIGFGKNLKILKGQFLSLANMDLITGTASISGNSSGIWTINRDIILTGNLTAGGTVAASGLSVPGFVPGGGGGGGGGGSGSFSSVANVGTGYGVFKRIANDVMELRTILLSGPSYFSISDTTNEITIALSDGPGSGMNADLLDGQHGAFYQDLGNATGTLLTTSHGAYTDATHHALVTISSHGFMSSTDKTKMDTIEEGATADQSAPEILASLLTVDGPGTGLNADLLDDQHGSYYLDLANSTGVLNTANFADNSVTFAKMQDLDTYRFIGRYTAATGNPESLTPALARTILNVSDGADVTNSTTVAAAGAVMETDTTTALMQFVIDEDTMVSNLPTKVPTQQSVKAYVDAAVASSVTYQGSYDAATNTPNLDSTPVGVTIGDMYTVTAAGSFFTVAVEVGDVLIAEVNNPTLESQWTIVNKDLNAASIKTSYESNPDTNAFTDAEQIKLSGIETGATADQTAAEILTALLTVDGATSGLDADLLDGAEGSFYQNASNLISGTLPAARFNDTAHGNRGGGSLHANVIASGASGFMLGSDKAKLDGIEDGATADQTAIDIRALGFFDVTNDGATSGLDADLLDGQEGSFYETNTTNVAAAGAIMDSDIASTEGLIRKTGVGTYEGVKTTPLYNSLRNNHVMSGGDLFTFSSTNYLTWSNRIITMGQGQSADWATSGYHFIEVPAAGTALNVHGGAGARNWTADGVLLAQWESLWYELPLGFSSVATNFHIVYYSSAFEVPYNWVLIGVVNGDTTRLKLFNHLYLTPGQSKKEWDGVGPGTYTGHQVRTGAGTYAVIKNNLAATVAPTTTDDTNSDYSVGSMWIDTTNDKSYLCVNNTASNAVWNDLTSGGGGGVSSGGMWKPLVTNQSASGTTIDIFDGFLTNYESIKIIIHDISTNVSTRLIGRVWASGAVQNSSNDYDWYAYIAPDNAALVQGASNGNATWTAQLPITYWASNNFELNGYGSIEIEIKNYNSTTATKFIRVEANYLGAPGRLDYYTLEAGFDNNSKGSAPAVTGFRIVGVAGTETLNCTYSVFGLNNIASSGDITASIGSEILLQSIDVGAGGTPDFTDFINNDLYDNYVVDIDGLVPITDNADLRMYVSTNNGASWVTTSDYAYNQQINATGSLSADNQLAAAATIQIIGSVGNAPGETATARVSVFSPSDTNVFTLVHYDGTVVTGTPAYGTHWGSGVYKATTAVNGIRFAMNGTSGGITSGRFKLYGIAKSSPLAAGVVPAFENRLLHIQDQQGPTTYGQPAVAGTTITRNLNTVLTNEITGASLLSNNITLPEGTYYIEASAPAFNINNHRAHLYNGTDTLVVLLGTSEYASGGGPQTRSFITGRFTVPTGGRLYNIRHYSAASNATNGFGVWTNDGLNSVYTNVKIWKIG